MIRPVSIAVPSRAPVPHAATPGMSVVASQPRPVLHAGLPVSSKPHWIGRTIDTSPLKGLKVLHVDDCPEILNGFRPIFEGWGMVVRGATGVYGASQAIQEARPDILILDFVLGGIEDGAEFFSNLLSEGIKIPTLFLSGSQGNSHAAMMLHYLGLEVGEKGVPFVYHRKDPKDLDGLAAKLLRLAGMREFPEEWSKVELPRLHSLVADLRGRPSLFRGDSQREIYKRGCELFVDHRFLFLLEMLQVFKELEELGVEDERIREFREDLLSIHVPFEELLRAPYEDWHTYKSGLTAMILALRYLQRILESLAADPKIQRVRELLENIRRGRLASLIELSKTVSFLLLDDEKGATAIGKSVIGFVEYFKNVRGVSLERRVSIDEDLTLLLPRNFIGQILMQLALNAVEHSPEGAEAPTVIARIARRGQRDFLYLAVSNVAAEPIPLEVREKMFGNDPYTTKPHGTGFGLTSVRSRLDAVGGDFRIRSMKGRTEIGVMIPIDPKKTGGIG